MQSMKLLHALFPEARAEILRCLFADPSKEMFLRELARQSGMALRTIQQEVEKLESLGLLIRRQDGNRVYWKANVENPIFPELRSLAIKTSGLPEQVRNALSKVEGIQFAFIFGSIAAGSETANSDVDLIVLGSVGLRKLASVLRPLSTVLAREINPHVMSMDEFLKKAADGDAFAANVLAGPKVFVKGSAHEFGRLG